MDPEARYTLVGSAVLILVALVVGAVLWLRSTGEGRNDRQYKIYFVTQSLEGLEARSDVRMRGIRIGFVTGFAFSTRRPGAVEVIIRVDGSAPVRESTQAVVERHLVTGIASIRLLNLSEESPLLVQAPDGEPYPVIIEGESAIQQFSESVNQLAQRADETMQRITATLSPQNQAALTEVLANLKVLTRDADRAVVSAAGAADEVRKLAASVAQDARRLTERYDAVGKQAGTSLTDITGEVRAMREDVARLAARADALMASGDAELRATAQALRGAAEALGATAARLRDPGQVIYGPPEGALGPGEGRR
jgi:phospholipid/cholesterol/gamma-HCH transport system substrate-binding protein